MGRSGETSRERLLAAARTLYATRGFESTTTSAIARAAGTSQSQFVKHFQDKHGVLAAILQSGWAELVGAVRLATERMNTPRERLHLAIDMLLSYFNREREFRAIVLREGSRLTRRAGGNSQAEFLEFLDETLEQMVAAGELPAHVNPRAVRVGLLGSLANLLHESDAVAETGAALPFSEDEVRHTLRDFLAGVLAKEAAPVLTVEEGSEPAWSMKYMQLADKVLGRSGLA